MALTAQQANQALANVTTVDQLRSIINQLAIEASGKTTVLYSGTTANGVDNSSLIQGMLRNGDDIRVIDNTEAAKFLQLDKDLPNHNEVLADKLAKLGLSGDPIRDRNSPANKFLFGDVDANGTRIPNGAWDNISGRFVDATVGEVRTLSGGGGGATAGGTGGTGGAGGGPPGPGAYPHRSRPGPRLAPPGGFI